MWFFNSPEIVFGEGALSYLAQVHGQRAFIVTDPFMVQFGFVELVKEQLDAANIESRLFDQVEVEPSLETVRRGAALMLEYEPDWIVGLGGGSAMDAAKAMWALYECPDLPVEAISPVGYLGIGKKAKLILISTTSGTGSEVTWATVLTDTRENRKLGLGSRELTATIAIVDPIFTTKMPPRLTADTGLDVLTHAIEGYNATWHNDFADGMCLKAIELVFKYLPRVYADGSDLEAREKMHNAAALAGLGFINSMATLAHAMGHTYGANFKVPHGRCVSAFLPYTMEFSTKGGNHRYDEMARFLGLPARTPEEGAASLIQAVRDIEKQVGSATALSEMKATRESLSAAMGTLLDHAQNDTQIVAAPRIPERAELEKLFWYAYEGKKVDF
ncbi:MAG: iron-containing alcohol dehydrogenase [Anaerolineae bacterium]